LLQAREVFEHKDGRRAADDKKKKERRKHRRSDSTTYWLKPRVKRNHCYQMTASSIEISAKKRNGPVKDASCTTTMLEKGNARREICGEGLAWEGSPAKLSPSVSSRSQVHHNLASTSLQYPEVPYRSSVTMAPAWRVYAEDGGSISGSDN